MHANTTSVNGSSDMGSSSWPSSSDEESVSQEDTEMTPDTDLPQLQDERPNDLPDAWADFGSDGGRSRGCNNCLRNTVHSQVTTGTPSDKGKRSGEQANHPINLP